MANTSAIFKGAYTKLLTSLGLGLEAGQKIKYTTGAAAGAIPVSDAQGVLSLGTLSGASVNTGLTQGSVPFIGASGVLAEDNSNLFYDNTNDRLGVGINVPLAKVHAAGTSDSIKMIAQAGAGQTANVQEWRNSSAAVMTKVLANGNMTIRQNESGVAGTGPTFILGVTTQNQLDLGTYEFTSPYAFQVNYKSWQSGQFAAFFSTTAEGKNAGMIHYDVANAKGRLCEFKTDPAVFFSISPSGLETLRMNCFGTQTVAATGSWTFTGWTAGESPMVVKGVAAQTADLQQWQDSTTAVKASVCPLGCATFTGLQLGIRTVTSAPTLTKADYTVLCDATTAGFSVVLPAAATNSGRILNVKKIDSTANVVTIDGNASETIDGALTYAINEQYRSIQLQCNGSNWYVV